MLALYNTLHRKKEPFTSRKKTVTLYSCGPTVYHDVHIGNYRTFITVDLLKRTLRTSGYRVKHVMNITDVGHLVGDGDFGEDKIERGAAREHTSAWQIARHYEKLFRADMRALNMIAPDVWPRATAHIKEQIALIRTLEKKGFTYRTGDGIYFDSTKFPAYGALTGLHAKKDRAGARVAMGEKKHATDFALWKFSPAGVHRQMEWNAPWGRGFPGWHIECSAMAMKYLGSTIDIHAGGIDLIPVHHTNEIAQSECATGKPFVRYWVHSAFVLINEEKMARSSGNFTTLHTLEEKGFSPLDFRYLTLQTHYRKELRFSWEALAAARTARTELGARVAAVSRASIAHAPTVTACLEACADDIGTPRALAILWNYAHTDPHPAEFRATALAIDELFGLRFKAAKKDAVPRAIAALIHERARARAEKNWRTADALRAQINERGFDVQDTVHGQTVRRTSV